MMPARVIVCMIFILVAMTACYPGTQPVETPTIIKPTDTNSPVTDSYATSTSTTPVAPALDEWDDRSVFEPGLIEEAKIALGQLPGASIYHLDVVIADDLTSLTGRERVRYTNQEKTALDVVYFQLFPNLYGGKSELLGVEIDGQEVLPVYESGNSAVRIPLLAPIAPGEQALIEMDFQIQVPTEAGGNYGLFGYLKGILVLDGFYPVIPVFDDQGWHAGKLPPNADSTFQDASFYRVQVTAPAALILVASGVQVERAQEGDNQVVVFVAGPARDFYLAASDQFAIVSKAFGETTVNSYASKDRMEGARNALETAVKALESFSARFGTYPYTEFDVVSTPMEGAVGIEYPGITGINLDAYDPKGTISGAPAPVMLEAAVAHEVGHQWFYNAVGNDQWNEPWLDEAVTQYVTGLYYIDRYGQQGFAGYRESWVSRWERVEREAIPIGLPAADYQGREYSAIVYGRGPLFIEQLAQTMGQESFDRFLRRYYLAHLWGIGTSNAFEKMAESSCNCDLTTLFEEWVYPK